MQAGAAVGGALVSGLSRLDKWLEDNKALPVLGPQPVAPEVADESGELLEECRRVRGVEGGGRGGGGGGGPGVGPWGEGARA